MNKTEKSAINAMQSEHAGYGSSKYYLKTILPTNGFNHLKSIGDEAASVIVYTDKQNTIVLTYSSESHNSPSYICPYPGAATGTGGNQRDNIAQTCRKPEAIYEARRQGLETLTIQQNNEATKGIADYGNAMGIPHGDGSMKYDIRYNGNHLVNVACISIGNAKELINNKVPTKNKPEEYFAIYIGKASDRTGLGGTRFASQGIDTNDNITNESAVQDPDPHLQEAECRGFEILLNTALSEGWLDQISIKDMGAAGLLCSTLEQLHSGMGVRIKGHLIPQNELRTAIELLEAETQERFLIYCHKKYVKKILNIFNKQIGLPYINDGAKAKVIGQCNNSGRYVFELNNKTEVDLPISAFDSNILYNKIKEPIRNINKNKRKPWLLKSIKKILTSNNFKNDKYIYNHYDKHVRNGHVITRGQACATLRTHKDLINHNIGYSMVFDSNCIYGLIDPKQQAEDSFIRGAYKLAAMGCSVIGATNNANYGRTNIPEEMWEFVEGQKGVAKACNNWKLEQDYLDMLKISNYTSNTTSITVNSGNCSLNKYNTHMQKGISPTTILGLVGWTNQVNKYCTWDLKPIDSLICLINKRDPNLGGTDYLRLTQQNYLGEKLFNIDYKKEFDITQKIIRCVREGLFEAINIIEEGGLCNCICEMLANTAQAIGIDIIHVENEEFLFSENYGAIIQISKNNIQILNNIFGDNNLFKIGTCKPVTTGYIKFKPYNYVISQTYIKTKYEKTITRKDGFLGIKNYQKNL